MRDVSTGGKEEDRSRRAWWRSQQRPVNSGEPSAILVVDTDFIGDVILATPVLSALRRRFPTAHLTLATSPEVAPLLVAHPALDQVVALDPRPGLGGALRLLRQLRALRPHEIVVGLSVIPARGWVAVLAAWFCGARQRLSVQADAADDPALHWSEIFHRVLRPLGIDDPPEPPQLATSPQARRTVQQFLDDHSQPERPWIGVNPGGRIYNLPDRRKRGRIAPLSRRWPAERFAALVARLLNDGATVFLTGSKEDASTTLAIAGMLDEAVSDRLIDTTGLFSLTETAALIERMDVFVSNDTGPMHIAFALNVPTVALFGPTDPRVAGPLASEVPHQVLQPHLLCSPCCGRKLVACRNPAGQECLTAVSVDAVYAAVARTRAARTCTPTPTPVPA